MVWAIINVALREQAEWEEFASTHDCRVVGEESGSVGTGLTSGGNVALITTPGKVAYECNDGVTYWRSK